MQNNFPKIPLLIAIAFLLFSCSAFIFSYREINNNQVIWQQKETEWQQKNTRNEDRKTLEHSIKIMEKEITDIGTHFVRTPNIALFLDKIEALALKVGAMAEISSVDLLEDKTNLMVGLKVSGSFVSVYKFLTLLENFPYELEILYMDMQKLSTSGASPENVKSRGWEAIFKLKVLSFIP